MILSPDQDRALTEVQRWLRDPAPQVFRLFGYAGTGKTTIVRHLAEGVGGVAYGAFSGKAASVMRRNGCAGATTIHSLIYAPVEDGRYEKLKDLREKRHNLSLGYTDAHLDAVTTYTTDQLVVGGWTAGDIERCRAYAAACKEADIEANQLRTLSPRFVLNKHSKRIANADLIVIDEVSMVNEKMAKDLLSFGKKVLVLGDPGQLPPVEGLGYFIDARPDVMLTEIHRQARENPIIALATMAREGRKLGYGAYGNSKVIAPAARTHEDIVGPQIIVGLNESRRMFNNLIREAKGFQKGEVTPSERIVCLSNNHGVGLLNGSMWTVKAGNIASDDGKQRYGEFSIESEDDGSEKQLFIYTNHFRQIERGDFTRCNTHEFDFAYAVTCHKAQGSQWDGVTVVNESFKFRDMSIRWLYTAITRAIENVTVIQWD